MWFWLVEAPTAHLTAMSAKSDARVFFALAQSFYVVSGLVGVQRRTAKSGS